MILRELVERFEREAPGCVMLRATLEHVFSAERLDAIFEQATERQRNKVLLFSTVADLMGMVAAKIRPSLHAAYQARQAELGVTVKALYDKLQRLDANVSREVVRETAGHMARIIAKLGGQRPSLLPGYRVKILDGNHLRRTERRIGELRALNAAPLPGQALVVLDPALQLAVDVFPCEDAYAQERSLLPQVLDTVEARDLWIADRNFCTTGFLVGLHERRARFVIRQHAQTLHYTLAGRLKRLGRTETGVVYGQGLLLETPEGGTIRLRRITIKLDQPTRDKEQELHLLTNLPARVSGLLIAEMYRQRWTIETAFQEVATLLHGEIETLGYPRAALFAFAMALVVFNVCGVLRGALRAVHGAQVIDEQFSLYYLCDEITHTYRGLEIAVGEEYWRKTYAHLSISKLAAELLRLARMFDLARYRKHPRGPKKPTPKLRKHRRPHTSTARVLKQATA